MTKSLYDLWNAQDDKRLAPKPFSVRLPVHILARLQALGDLHPTKSRNDLFIDLIKAGFEAFEGGLPTWHYEELDIGEGSEQELILTPTGYKADYYRAANQHYQEIEKELGNTKPSNLFDVSAKRK